MFVFLTVVQALVAAALVGVILMQRSEGGGLGVGGNPSGFMSARGAADVLTRTTTILAILFVSLSIALAILAASRGAPASIDQSLQRDTAPIGAPQSESFAPLGDADDPLAATAEQAAEGETGGEAATPAGSAIPLDQ